MRIRFFNPPVFNVVGQHYRLNQAVGGPLLSAILRQTGHDASYVDAEALRWNLNRVADYLCKEGVEAIGVTVTNLNWEASRQFIAHIKGHLPHIWIAVGGPEVTARPADARMLGADCVAPGEGDASIVFIFEDKPGYYQPDGVVRDLDSLPMPAWEYSLPLPTKYMGNMPRFESPEVCTLWNRGCAHKCTFCSNPVFNRVLIRERSPGNILEELRKLKILGAKHIFVYSDELIGMSPRQAEWLGQVCEAIIKADLGLTFKTQGRCSPHATEEVLMLMARAGFKAIMWGIESMAPNVLQAVKKGITPEDVWATLEASHKAGIANWGFFMVGMPEETQADFALTVQALAEMKQRGLLQWQQVNICTPSPGTELWRQATENGWLKVSIPSAAGHFHQVPVMEFPYASQQEIKTRLAVLQAL